MDVRKKKLFNISERKKSMYAFFFISKSNKATMEQPERDKTKLKNYPLFKTLILGVGYKHKVRFMKVSVKGKRNKIQFHYQTLVHLFPAVFKRI